MSSVSHRMLAITSFTLLVAATTFLSQQPSIRQPGRYEDSLVLAPHYIEFLTESDARFSHQVSELKRRLGSAPHVLVGFAASLPISFPAVDIRQTLTENQMAASLDAVDRIVERARASQVIVHITLTSGFFHGMNDLRPAAIQSDVRNAQWFADGWIGVQCRRPARLRHRRCRPVFG